MASLSVSIIQADLKWEDIEYNLENFDRIISRHKDKSDLYILPETFSTGFTMEISSNADPSGKALQWMLKKAKDENCAIAGSLIVHEDGCYYNRLYFVSPEGILAQYNKRHLFRMGREDKFFTPGDERVIVAYKGFRIILQICYDLRFPVFVRNRNDYDAIVYVANWPSPRKEVWESLLPARAIENQCYVIGANRSGVDGEGIGTCGLSMIVDPKGQKIARLDDQAGLISKNLDLSELIRFRQKFPVFFDADDFEMQLD